LPVSHERPNQLAKDGEEGGGMGLRTGWLWGAPEREGEQCANQGRGRMALGVAREVGCARAGLWVRIGGVKVAEVLAWRRMPTV
jgi:hypothetical protein